MLCLRWLELQSKWGSIWSVNLPHFQLLLLCVEWHYIRNNRGCITIICTKQQMFRSNIKVSSEGKCAIFALNQSFLKQPFVILSVELLKDPKDHKTGLEISYMHSHHKKTSCHSLIIFPSTEALKSHLYSCSYSENGTLMHHTRFDVTDA